jgi:HlyD family secretion protein
MTARVDFLVKSAESVLKAPNAALRYKPSDDVLARFGTAPASGITGTPTAATAPASPRAGASGTRASRSDGGASGVGEGTLYMLDAKGKLQIVRVRTGISDGAFTEVQGQNLTEGMKIIDGIVSASQKPAAAPANPLSGGQQPGRGRPGGGF